jgi:predicted neuraminidase
MTGLDMKILLRELLPKEKEFKASRHASTILPLGDGTVLAAYFAGTKEAEPDVDIYITRRNPNGIWTTPARASREEGIAHWNPVMAFRSNNEIVLFYKVGFRICEWKTMLRISRDNGESWNEPGELVPGDTGGRGPVRNKPIMLLDGTWLAGGSLERGALWTAFADRSEDDGRTWQRSADIAIDLTAAEPSSARAEIPVSEQSLLGRGVIQPTLWESAPSIIHMLLRSSEGCVYRCDSADGGKTWCDPYPTNIPNNNSALDLIQLDDGRLVLAHNPESSNWGKRTPLILSISENGGSEWTRAAVLDEGPGEFSYPAIVKGSSNSLFVSWTRNRTDIAFACFSLS